MSKIKVIEQKVLDNEKVILEKRNKSAFGCSRIILPYISDAELLKRYRRIKPIVYYNELYYYLKKYNTKMMRRQPYISNLKKDIRTQVDMMDAKILGEFSCYHIYAYYDSFVPTIAEVLQQFPDDILEEANAFCMIEYPKNSADLSLQSEIVNAGCHRSKVRALLLKK